MHGFGTYRFADGATYEGVMRDNWPNGEGTARYSNGGVYVGRWRDGKYEVTHVKQPNFQRVFLRIKTLLPPSLACSDFFDHVRYQILADNYFYSTVAGVAQTNCIADRYLLLVS